MKNHFIKMARLKTERLYALLLLLILTLDVKHSGVVHCLSTVYNTTSGLYMARQVNLQGFGFDKPTFVHKLISVPYAEKPGRFEQSVMKKYEPGLHEPRQLVSCYQSVNLSSYGSFTLNKPPLMTEDCLTVNLYIPVDRADENPNDYRNMSVVVHIHGGSNMVGGAGLFDGSILAAHGKVVVAIINYRLSILGFLSDMSERYPGNYGLRDQLLAIKWLKINCPVFNCNPESITLWGHSAGAGDVNWLAISPLSNKLFQRVIIQSGSSFSYWGFDKAPFDRYKSLKKYFNCKNLPHEHTSENQAMTRLIDTCLKKVNLDDLFSFKFALIDAPGPIYDGFLGNNSLISAHSPKDMIDRDESNRLVELDIMTGINGVEGFSFEGYFSESAKYWTDLNLTNEVFLTLERFSLLARDKCYQNSVIGNRNKLDRFYENKVRAYFQNGNDLNSEEAKRLKAIFASSDVIFDTGFIELLTIMLRKKLNKRAEYGKDADRNKRVNLYVYEYLHENSDSQPTLGMFKKFLNKNYSLSTHFDGIDLLFGLPIAHLTMHRNLVGDYPFKGFQLTGGLFNKEDVKLSLILMTYYTNFIKYGNPNVGVKVPVVWEPYENGKAYLTINKDLIETADRSSSSSGIQQRLTHANQSTIKYGIRDDLYDFWFVEMDKLGQCNRYGAKLNGYKSGNHTGGAQPAMDKCLELLDKSYEYNYLREMFLYEYETCMNAAATSNLFNTICLDIIAIRRMLIEYELCCLNRDKHLNVTSTICTFKNFNTRFVGYKLNDLIAHVKNANNSSSPKSLLIVNNWILISTLLFISLSRFSTYRY